MPPLHARRPTIVSLLAAVGLVAAPLVTADASADVSLRTIAVHGTPAAPGLLFERFDAPSINGAGEVFFWSRLATMAVNNECSTAIDLLAGAAVFSTAGATTSSAPAPCIIQRDVWFKFTAPQAGSYQFALRGLNFQARMNVYRGSCQQLLATSCDITPLNLAANENVFIRVGSGQSSSNPVARGFGTGVLTIWPAATPHVRGLALDAGLFLHAGEAAALAVREGDAFQKSPPLFHAGLELPAWSDAGIFAFAGAYTGPTPVAEPVQGLFVGTPDGGTVLVEAETIPKPPAVPDRYLTPPKLDASGRIAYTHLDAQRLVVGELALDANDPASGIPGAVFAAFDQPVVAAPAVAFRATVTGDGIDAANNTAIWLDPTGETPDSATLIARTGDAAPGIVPPATFARLAAEPAISAAGTLAVHARLVGEGLTDANNAGLWTTRDGSLSLLARQGDGAPGVPNASFARLPTRQAINADADIAFTASLVGDTITAANNTAIWIYPANDAPRLLAREGDQVPGLPAGIAYASFSDPVINDHADIAFTATLRGNDITYPSSTALLLAPRAGTPVVIIRTGDTIALAPGDTHTVGEFSFGASAQGSGRATLNNSGELVFECTFVDGLAAILVARHECRADFNDDTTVNSQDFFDFLVAFFDNNLTADFNRDGAVNSQDFFDFLGAFFTGC
jgi:hypothetical protein